MSIGAPEIKAIARLARIGIEESEIDRYAAQISQILAYVEAMNEIDTSGVTPLAHAIDLVARVREDAVTESDARSQFQACAPQVEEGYYLVPRVIE